MFRGSGDRKSTRLNSSHGYISYAVFCLKKKNILIELGQQHKKGNKNAGINVFSGKVPDMKKENVIEPIRVGSQELSSAQDAAEITERLSSIYVPHKLRRRSSCNW